ncbi:6576_t:CDS:2, partial [Ambispora gerdemannii]
ILEARLDDIDHFVDNLDEIISKKNNSYDLNENSRLNGLDLSTIDIQNLLMISNNIGLGLYDVINHKFPKE